jgi:peptidoglycan hydrolase-like protein with peptidoglycan-binding domain
MKMKSFGKFCGIIISFISLPFLACANTATERFYGSFIYNIEIPNTLFLFGGIKQGDSFEFRKALRSHEISTIVLASPGGSVWAGLSISGIIFDKRLNVYVPNEASCASACAFMFFAGAERKSAGKLGVHQFYSTNSESREKVKDVEAQSQFTVSEIVGFLNEFQTPRFVLEKMFQQKDIYWFDDAEIKELETKQTANIQLNSILYDDYFKSKIEEKKEAKSKSVDPKEIIISVQLELNRVGCNLGRADGVVGPASLRALRDYSTTANVAFEESNFTDGTFLESLRAVPAGFCPKPKLYSGPKTKWSGKTICRKGSDIKSAPTKASLINKLRNGILVRIVISYGTGARQIGITIMKTGKGHNVVATDSVGNRMNGAVTENWRSIALSGLKDNEMTCSITLN